MQAPNYVHGVDDLINAWQELNLDDDRPWVLFEHGTCVYLSDPEPNLYAHATKLLKVWGPVIIGTSFGDFDVLPEDRGWLVTCHDPDIVTLVVWEEVEQFYHLSGDHWDQMVGLTGRDSRHRDALALRAIHVSDSRELGNNVARSTTTPWTKLVSLAQDAMRRSSNWERYAIPLNAIVPLTESEVDRPIPALETISMPPDVLARLNNLEYIIRKAGRLPSVATLTKGVARTDPSYSSNQDFRSFEQIFEEGRFVELTGLCSASGIIEPPLYAAGAEGALLEMEVHSAARISLINPLAAEDEFLLPRNCRCQVMQVEPSRTYIAEDGSQWHRPTVKLRQL